MDARLCVGLQKYALIFVTVDFTEIGLTVDEKIFSDGY